MIAALITPETPIDLPDDGLREFARGRLRGKFEFVSHENPSLVAATIAEKSMKRIIKARNEQRYG